MHIARSNLVLAIILILTACFPLTLAAQEDGDDPDVEPDWELYTADLYSRGDQTFLISLGTTFPTVFVNKGEVIDPKFNPRVGGTGSLIYSYYLHSRFFLGGELSGMFINTRRKNNLFIIPLGVRVGTQFIVWRFEFPINLSLGMAWHTYLDFAHYGFYMKFGAGAYFRATSSWSFGISADWSWYPEWTSVKNHNVNGNFVNTMISARYHF